MKIIFIVVAILCSITTFANLSRGSIFTENVKNLITLVYWIILVALSIASIFVGGKWYYVLIVPCFSLVLSWIVSFILSSTICKYKY